jgi:hypothetical protein
MENLQNQLIARIEKEVAENTPNNLILDALNRLLGTVTNYNLNVKK